MTFFPDALSEGLQAALRETAPFLSQRNFYLAGGTALAIYLRHRVSEDLDWFTENRIPDPLALAGELQGSGIPFAVSQVERGTLHGQIHGVRVSFLEYRYPLLFPLAEWPEFGCLLASMEDIVCMKLSAIAQRGSKKDFIDLYALMEDGLGLAKALELYRKRFGVEDIAHVLYGLAYFDDAEKEKTPKMLWDVDWETVRESLRKYLKEYAKITIKKDKKDMLDKP